VSWALRAMKKRHLALWALDTAAKRRCPNSGWRDYSIQKRSYAIRDFEAALEAGAFVCNPGRRGNCLEIAAMESVFSNVSTTWGTLRQSRREVGVVRRHRNVL